MLFRSGLIVDDVGLSVNRVGSDGTTGTGSSTDALQSDVRTTAGNGNIVIRSNGGTITLNDGTATADYTGVSANGTGNVLLEAIGAGTDVVANVDVASGSGNVSVLGARDVKFTGTADILTTSTAAGSGSIDVMAGSGSVTQSATSLFQTTGATGTIRVLGQVDVTVGDIVSATGTVSVTATTGNILDADPLLAGPADDADIDVTANKLRLFAGTGVGQNTNHLETTVGTVSARATSGGIYLRETDALKIGRAHV